MIKHGYEESIPSCCVKLFLRLFYVSLVFNIICVYVHKCYFFSHCHWTHNAVVFLVWPLVQVLNVAFDIMYRRLPHVFQFGLVSITGWRFFII